MASPFLKLSVLVVLIFTSCKKENDDYRNKYEGNYELKGTIKYVFDGFGRYEEQDGLDTASLSIAKPNSPDSSAYILLKGVEFYDYRGSGGFTGGYCLKFVKGGVPIIAEVIDTTLAIPLQFPYSGGSLSISGTGSIVNKKLTITYKTHYRGFYKNSTITTY